MFSIILAGAAAVAQPVPQEPIWAWDCSEEIAAPEGMGTLKATLHLDEKGKFKSSQVHWSSNPANGPAPRIDMDWGFSQEYPEKLTSSLIFIYPPPGSEEKIGKRKFIWRIDVEKYANSFLKDTGFISGNERIENGQAPGMMASASMLFALARGADSLNFIAQDVKTGETLLSEDLLSQKWVLVEQAAHALAARAVAKSKNQFTQCTRFDDTPVIVV